MSVKQKSEFKNGYMEAYLSLHEAQGRKYFAFNIETKKGIDRVKRFSIFSNFFHFHFHFFSFFCCCVSSFDFMILAFHLLDMIVSAIFDDHGGKLPAFIATSVKALCILAKSG